MNPMQLVMPPSPFMSPEAVVGMGVYTAKAVLEGKGRDVWEMIVENIPCPGNSDSRSPCGTEATSFDVRTPVALGGKADVTQVFRQVSS